MVGTESFLVMLFGGYSEFIDFVFYQKECHAKYRQTDFEQEDS